MAPAFAIFHIPHSSTVVPVHVRGSLCLSEKDLAHELFSMTDHNTDELFDYQFEPVHRIVFPVSRLVLDPERFSDDALEPMAKKGMGVVYMKTSDGRPLRHPGFIPTKTELIEEFYLPHHKELDTIVAESLRDYHSCLILDCHSFPLKPLPYESHSEKPRPEICLGTDRFHTPEWFAAEAERLFQMKGFRVARNYPFCGVLVPGRFYWKQPTVLALMIEVNRSLYMNEISGERLPEFLDFKNILLSVVSDLIVYARKKPSAYIDSF
jgi:N-formylglutamate amidohydrolase